MDQKEILPDVILMPNAGTRTLMWQETSGAKIDTPARFLFPIFSAVDLDDQMVECIGRYRLGDLQTCAGCILERYPGEIAYGGVL